MPFQKFKLFSLILLGLVITFGTFGYSIYSGHDGYNANAKPIAAQSFETQKLKIKVEVIANGLDYPWGMAMLPDGKLLITERPGRLLLLDPENGNRQEVTGLPPIAAIGQGGLLDIALDPDFASNHTLYFTFSDPGSDPSSGVAGTAIASAMLKAGEKPDDKPALKDVKILYSLPIKDDSGHHFGSRIAISQDGKLFFTIGDRGNGERAQDLGDGAGSVLRINKDGTIPDDNPFVGKEGADPAIWSYGHRNPQGAAIDPKTGTLYTVEHGAKGGDELNQPQKGVNYGWPVISYGVDYSGAKIGIGTKKDGMAQPLHYWDPSIAPSGLSIYRGTLFPQWDGNLLVGALKFERMKRLALDDKELLEEEDLIKDQYGRIRDLRVFQDEAIWVLTDSDDGQLLRITPETQ